MGLYLEDFVPGRRFVSPTRTVAEADVMLFAGLTGDHSELHTSEVWARESGPFGRRVAHGLLCLGIGHALMIRLGILEGTAVALLGLEDWRFTAPVFFGDTLHAEFEVCERRPSTSRPDRGIVTFGCAYINQDGVVVQSGRQVSLVLRRPEGKPG